jgi:glycosyltransferase involved in cell wall biosynthesis
VLHDRQRVEALSDAEVFCFPGERDSFGLAPFEALACGTPVVALASGGSGEWLAQSGGAELVPADPESMAAALVRALSAPAAARSRAQAGAKWVLAHLGWERIAAAYSAVYTTVVNSEPRSGRATPSGSDT